MGNQKLAPGPRGAPLVGNLTEFRRDVLGLMMRSMHEYGDIVRIRLGPVLAHLLCHPHHIEYVLKNRRNYDKNTLSSRIIARLTGSSLLVSNDTLWETQRRTMQPAFSPPRTAAYVPMMSHSTEQMLKRWASWAVDGRPFDIASEMMQLTYRIVERALFSTLSSSQLEDIEAAITVALQHTYRVIERGGIIPHWLPTPGNVAFQKAVRTLDQRVYDIINQHREHGDMNDLVSLLLAATDEQTGRAMDQRQLRNEIIALLIAGHETTANALTWLWYLLGQHQDVAANLHDEVDSVLAGRLPTAEDLDRLPQTTMAVLEAMRIYTPIWSMIRNVVADDEIDGYKIPARSRIVISPYVTHRHPEFWSDPERFDPSRFERDQFQSRHHYAYIPFGGGPRICIGQNFAKAEAVVIAAMVMQAYHVSLVPNHPVSMQPGITLRAQHGVKVTIKHR